VVEGKTAQASLPTAVETIEAYTSDKEDITTRGNTTLNTDIVRTGVNKWLTPFDMTLGGKQRNNSCNLLKTNMRNMELQPYYDGGHPSTTRVLLIVYGKDMCRTHV